MPSTPDRREPAERPSGPKAARTRELLVGAAREQFLQRGYLATSVDDIAEAAGVSRPSFYTYFRSKREVVEAVGLLASDLISPLFDALGELGPDFTTDDVAAWVRSYFDYHRVHGPWALVWFEAVTLDGQLEATGRANRRHHARRIGKHLQSLGALPGTDPLYDGLIVLGVLDTLWGEVLRSPASEAAVVDAAARALEAIIRRT
ncbi:MAG TPA: TetR/AcrR family transcriptional regulator [Acidimicrobiia bacterium]|nr:TetR/AcrR family transcriptional regulator [Acidimicrobiia bacterium]